MITREELIEKAARAVFEVRVKGIPFERSLAAGPITEDARLVIRIALEAAIEIAHEQRRPYSEHDPDEAHNYAIGDVTDAIRSLIPENEHG